MIAFLDDIARHAGEGRALAGLPGGAAARAVALLAQGPTWVLTPDADEADLLAAELRFWLGEDRVRLYPADDTRPYEGLSPHPALPQQRAAALYALGQGRPVVVVAPAQALLARALPPALLAGAPTLRVGQRLNPQAFAQTLADWGYLAVGRVEDPGTFALRGEVLDLWPAAAPAPLRAELLDDEVESLRTLDPRTLRSTGAAGPTVLLPAREEVLGEPAVDRAMERLREQVGVVADGARRRREVIEDLRAGIRFSGCGDYLPALHALVPALEHGPGARLLVLGEGAVHDALHRAWQEVHTRFRALAEAERPLVGPELRYLHPDAVLEGRPHLSLRPLALEDGVDLGCQDTAAWRPGEDGLAPLVARLRRWLDQGGRAALVCPSTSRAERLRELLDPHGLRPRELREARDPARWPPGELLLLRGDLPRGFVDPRARLLVLTADEWLGGKVRVRSATRTAAAAAHDAAALSFGQLKDGDLVVHRQHGVGRFLGLRRLDLGHGPMDMVQLEYRGGDRLYLPAFKLDQLSRYQAMGATDPRLDRLGGDTWSLRKARVRDHLLRLAHELVQTHARRQVVSAPAFAARTARMRSFEDSFPYTETPDQAAAIVAVAEDLSRPEPMDRLVVGDVGFGKTEVAMRAAFQVAEGGGQVAVLCPTTVLAFQHARTFAERFGPFGHEVALLSRFDSSAEARRVLEGLRSGAIRVVIGTTKLLGRGVRFARLDLVIVDEEHRFGVKQKEQLKRLRSAVHLLSMSATPIPRTLNQALSGVRPISVINTPPEDRLPVRTAVVRFSEERVREELLRELRRGGQAFFIHSRVEDLPEVAAQVARIVPEARVELAHGQLEDEALERVLVRFVERRFDVLVCTTIVEAGLDMPNVNTILVHEAERFGLAQLYQLRGRVGRSHRRGYCTLLLDPTREVARDVGRRLQVLQEHTALGSGFAVATADLELRGAGNLLGEQQHGAIRTVGFETWLDLLEDAMAEARGEAERDRIDPELELGLAAFIPEGWLRDPELRLALYRRLASARTVEALRRLLDEQEAELGELPLEMLNLGRLLELKLRCRRLGVLRCSMLKVRVVFELADSTRILPDKLNALCRELPRRVRSIGQRVEVLCTPEEATQPYAFVHWALGLLDGCT